MTPRNITVLVDGLEAEGLARRTQATLLTLIAKLTDELAARGAAGGCAPPLATTVDTSQQQPH